MSMLKENSNYSRMHPENQSLIAEMTQKLARKAVDILTEHGKHKTVPFSARIIPAINLFLGWIPTRPLNGNEEIFNVCLVEGKIDDHAGKLFNAVITSYGNKEPKDAQSISIKLPQIAGNEIDTLLLTKQNGRINARLWNGNKDNIWEERGVSMEELTSASRILDLFQESLHQK